MPPGRDAASPWRGHHPSGQKAAGGYSRPLLGALVLLLAWGSAAPARADVTVDGTNSPYEINGAVPGPVFVKSGGVLNIDAGADISAADTAVVVSGGTVYISGGTLSGGFAGLDVEAGVASVSGGSFSGGSYGISYGGGTLSIYGSCLALSGTGQLTGTLKDGTPLSIPTSGLSTANLFGAAPAPVVTLNGAGSMTVECHSSFTDPGATAYDPCAGSLPVFVSGSVDASTPGTYTLTYKATGAGGNNGFATRTVTVVDSTPPVITLNGASSMTVECHTPFTDPGATANDACAGSLPVYVSGSMDINTPGTYTLFYKATDTSGNNGFASRTVTVVDTTPPVITLNGASPMTVECHTPFTDPGAKATDACAGSVAVTASGSVDANTPGTYTLTYSAKDPSGNPATAVTRTVKVVDTTAPVITLNGGSQMTVECHGSFTDPGATANDACAGSVPVTLSFGSVDPNTPGTYKLTYTATDPSGNSGYINRLVTVVDTTPPVVTPPANITQAAAAGQCSASLNPGTATAADTCAGALTPTGTRSDGKALTDPYPVGTTTITWSATDPSGNKGSASQTITVKDTQPPAIACPGSITVPATSASGAVVSFTVGASDACGAATVTSMPPSGSTFPVGTTPVTSTAIDAAGNQSTCSFTVTVTPIADLSLTMSASPSPVVTGGSLTYTLVATNNGPQPALGVVLADPLPAGTGFASASGSPVTTPKAGTAGTVTWNVGTLGSGQSVTLTVVVKVTAKAGGTLTNTASVTGSTQDPNPGNNSALSSTAVVAKH
jgi:uncharacterized repeat protein (TIGR01451 family)